MVKPSVGKLLRLVHPLVEPDDGGDTVGVKIVEVMVGCVERVAVLDPALVVRTSEG